MGLDVFFNKRVGPGMTAEVPEFEREINLCGGMFSGSGADGSFRGKVYSPFTEDAIGTSLYEDLTADQCVQLGRDIAEWLAENPGETFTFGYELTRQEIEDLALMFTTFGEAGYGTWAWY